MPSPKDELEFERALGVRHTAPGGDDFDEQAFEASLRAPARPSRVTGASLVEQQAEEARAAAQREEELQAEYGGIGGTIAAGAEGLLRGASLGITDAISAGAQALALQAGMSDYQPTRLTPEAREKLAAYNKAHPDARIDTTNSDRGNLGIAYDLAREEQEGRREANPVTSTLAEVTGAIAPALLSGGATAPESGASLITRGLSRTPAGLVQRLGNRVATGIAGESTSLLTRGLAEGAGAAIEGGLSALALQASQTRAADIENPAQAAENLAYAVRTGSLLGGIFGAVTGVGGQALRNRAARSEFEATLAPAAPVTSIEQKVAQVDELQRMRGAAPDDVVDQEAGNLLHEAMQETEARPLSAAQLPMPERGKWRTMADQAAAAGGKFDDAVSEGTQQMRGLLDDALRDMDAIDTYGGIAAKKKANAFNVGHAVDASPINELLDGMEADVNAFMKGRSKAGLASGGGLGALDSLRLDLKQNRALINEAMQRGDVGEAYNLLDQGIKGRLGKIGDGTKNEGVRALMDSLYDRPQAFLEDESLWAEMAQRQKLANPSFSARIQNSKDQRIQSLLIRRTNERSNKKFRDQVLANDQTIANMLRTMGDDGTQGTEEAVRTWLRSMGRDATDRMRAWGSPELQERAARVVASVSKIEDVLDRVGRLKIDKLGHEKALKGSTIEMVGQLAANFGPNPVSAAIAMVVGAKRKLAQLAGGASPEVSRAARAAMPPATPLENAVGAINQSMSARIAQNAQTFFRSVAEGAPVAAGTATDGMLPEQRHERAVQRAVALSDPRSPETAQLIEEGAQLEEQSPQLADAYVGKVLRDANYIASKLPKNPNPGSMWSSTPPMDPIQERKFRRIVAAVANPAAALERVASGKALPDEADAVRTLNPAMFAEFQKGVAAELQKLKSPPDLETRLRASYVTGLPLDPSVSRQSLQFTQMVASMPDQQKAEEARVDDKNRQDAASLGDPYQTGSDEKFKGRDPDNTFASPVDRLIDRR